MLFYISYCSVFLGVVLAILASKSEFKKEKLNLEAEKSDAIFADIIKNISRVNNVLQELINNYEQLQKIYKSQENFDAPEYSTEAELDRYFKNNKKTNKNKERSFQRIPHVRTTNDYLQATQMIVSEEQEIDGSQGKSGTVRINKLKNDRLPKIERLQTAEKVPTTVKSTSTTIITTEQQDSEVTSEESYSSEESVEKTTLTTTTSPAEVVKPRTPTTSTQPTPEIIFVDTHKKMQDKKKRILPEALEEVTKKIKTRYSVKEMPGNRDASYGPAKSPRYLRENSNISKSSSKKSLQGESKSHNKSHAALTEAASTNKSKQLNKTTGSSTTGRSIVKLTESKSAVHLRSKDSNKTAKVFVANDVNKGEEDSSSEVTDDDEAITKDLFKTSVLRQAYGDACLKLVVRKCYKACKQGATTTCRRFKCKEELKSFFDKSIRTGCIKEFVPAEGKNKSDENTCRTNEDSEGIHADMTRAGYLSVACLPQIETGMPILLQTETPVPNGNVRSNKELNVLRDRYEKACARTSREKCNQACTYAHNATCIKFECEKRLKKNFKKNCRTQCNNAYKYSSSKGSSGSGSTGTEDSEDNEESGTASSS